MHDVDTILWIAMIRRYAIHGYSRDVLKIFDLIKHFGTNHNNMTFACVLHACNHAILVDEGCKYINNMSDYNCIIPRMNLYTYLVDHGGYIEEDMNFIIKIPIQPDLGVWMCLLSSCRSY